MSYEFNDNLIAALEKRLQDNLEKAANHLVNKVKEKVNEAEPYQIYRGKQGIWYHGLDPSTMNKPPKKIRGDLQRSITYEMVDNRTGAKVGSNLDYARYLELGTLKMEPRPFLRSTLDEQRAELNRIMGEGI